MVDSKLSRLRALAVLLAATAAAIAAGLLAWPEAAALPEQLTSAGDPNPSSATLDDALVAGAATVLLAVTAWLWLCTALTVASVLRHRATPVPGTPAWLHRGVLAACGVAVSATWLAGSAHSEPPPIEPQNLHGVSSVELPDTEQRSAAPSDGGDTRAGAQPPSAQRPRTPHRGVVRPGDTLWAIAAEQLGPDATPAQINTRWREIAAQNKESIENPDLIYPGQRLDVGPTTDQES